jgi:hypothetical protein
VPNIAIIDSVAHRDLRVDFSPSAARGDGRHVVQVAVSEFPQLATRCPLTVAKDSDTGAFFCGAVLGFEEGENLFLRAEGGYDGYRPLNLQREPLFVVDGRLAIDLDSPRVTEVGGEALFDGAGQPAQGLDRARAALEALRPGLAVTRDFLAELVRLRLLRPIEVELEFDDGSSRWLADIYVIDQERLRELPDAEVLSLFRTGQLYLIDLMILSVQQIPSLAERKNRRLSGLESDWTRTAGAA